MLSVRISIGDKITVQRSGFSELLQILQKKGYQLIGPRIRDGAIVYEQIDTDADLPAGWTDKQKAGQYRLEKRNDGALFAYVLGPRTWKQYLSPPVMTLWRAKRIGDTFEVVQEKKEIPQYAFIGVRACEIHAMEIQDKVFAQETYKDPTYVNIRKNAFILAVNCTRPGGTCFCASMKTGPKVSKGFDIALTEIINNHEHFFILEIGSERALGVVESIEYTKAGEQEIRTESDLLNKAVTSMGRSMDTGKIQEIFYRNYENPHWETVAKRCLTCANCTMVCPTCFCWTVEDSTDLAGDAIRVKKQDSCFTSDFSYIHGGSVRYSAMARYRQWLTHKLATWIDQFGTSGC
ncbi:MAG: 4Fe-4S dicluster domain-containing protein, partial [Chlamydiota bacterium]|nr:4Fe-4S dicluster domain-containing protein [Chlamydiota bacterium]